MPPPTEGPTAADGSPYPDRALPTFERDVRRMFASIVDRYEAFNHVATFGQDLVWRPRALWELDRFRRGPVTRALDIGCGTGEFAQRIAERYRDAEVVAADFTRAMVVEAWRRRARGPGGARLGFAVADALRLPFPDASFDLVANAFVARNLSDLARAFGELRRVLRPGGVLLTLEVSEPPSPTVGRVFHAHFDHVVPLLGRAVGREGPYTYLPRSLRNLPGPSGFVGRLRDSGFGRVEARPMSLGIVTAYLAEAGAGSDPSR